jgi:hypothetical protein
MDTPPGAFTPPDSRATAQPHPAEAVEAPPIAHSKAILDRFKAEVRGCGLVGEERNAATIYLAICSRLLDRQVSVAVKGHSASGKSWTVETVVSFFPDDEVIEFTAMSERALIYSKRDFRHRTLVVYEATALREGIEDNLTAYFVRSLLSEGRIEYEVTVRDEDGHFATKQITKQGPTNLLLTTTQVRVHAENETRLLSIDTDDSAEQTKRVLFELAEGSRAGRDVEDWHALQRWLRVAEHRVEIPYGRSLAELVPPVATRLRRDFAVLLAFIRAHAMLHQLSRGRDEHGRIVADIEDYAVVRELVVEPLGAGVAQTVTADVRETVAAVDAEGGLAPADPKDEQNATTGVMARGVGERLRLTSRTRRGGCGRRPPRAFCATWRPGGAGRAAGCWATRCPRTVSCCQAPSGCARLRAESQPPQPRNPA